mgnify:CR=1 FL=1
MVWQKPVEAQRFFSISVRFAKTHKRVPEALQCSASGAPSTALRNQAELQAALLAESAHISTGKTHRQ